METTTSTPHRVSARIQSDEAEAWRTVGAEEEQRPFAVWVQTRVTCAPEPRLPSGRGGGSQAPLSPAALALPPVHLLGASTHQHTEASVLRPTVAMSSEVNVTFPSCPRAGRGTRATLQ